MRQEDDVPEGDDVDLDEHEVVQIGHSELDARKSRNLKNLKNLKNLWTHLPMDTKCCTIPTSFGESIRQAGLLQLIGT